MKTFLKTTLLALMLSGCGNPLVGTWKSTRNTLTLKADDTYVAQAVVVFAAGGSTMPGCEVVTDHSGTWVSTGSTVTLTSKQASAVTTKCENTNENRAAEPVQLSTVEYTYSINGETLSLGLSGVATDYVRQE